MVAERCLAGCHKAADIGFCSQLPVESRFRIEGAGARVSRRELDLVWARGWGMADITSRRNTLAEVGQMGVRNFGGFSCWHSDGSIGYIP